MILNFTSKPLKFEELIHYSICCLWNILPKIIRKSLFRNFWEAEMILYINFGT